MHDTADRYRGFEYLEVTRQPDRVVLVTMNRPDKLNAADDHAKDELVRIWGIIDDDPDVNVAVLTGAGRAFCAGGDVSPHDGDPVERAHRMHERNVAAVWALVNMRKPLISAVNGVAVGAGVRLALLADISVMAEDARLIDGHTKIGIAAGDHSVMIWPLLCGMAQAKNLLMRNSTITGRDALRLGLVSECVPTAEVLPTALAIAGELARGPQWAVRSTKRALNHWLRAAAPAYEHSAALEALNTLHGDSAAGRRAVLARETPTFPSSNLGIAGTA